MVDWKTNKGEGPWDLTKQAAKWGYLNNPNWVVVPTADHKPCGYWFSGPGEITYVSSQIPDAAAWVSIAISGDGKYRTAVAPNRIYTSSDYGMTWSNKLTITKSWLYVNMSITGQYQIVGSSTPNGVWISSNYGVTWTQSSGPTGAISAIFSTSGQYQALNSNDQKVYVSYDFGVTWTLTLTDASSVGGLLGSSSGQHILSCSSGVRYSSDYGATWSGYINIDGAGYVKCITMGRNSGYCLGSSWYFDTTLYRSINYGQGWSHVAAPGLAGMASQMAISDLGQYQVVVWSKGGINIYTSNDYGITWVKTSAVAGERRVLQMSTDGQYLSTFLGTNIQLSSDFGATWHLSSQPLPITLIWHSTYFANVSLKAMSSTGQYQIACDGTSSIYSSSDYGETWSTKVSIKIVEENFGQKLANPVWPIK